MTSPADKPVDQFLDLALNAKIPESIDPNSFFIDYSRRDYEVADYQMFDLPCTPGIRFRGPALDPERTRRFFTCIGAAQTFGVYAQKPYPNLLAEKLGMPSLNLALGAAGPGFYVQHEELLDQVNKGRFLILQVMSARSEANSRFQPFNYVEVVRERKTGELLNTAQAWLRVLTEEPAKAPSYIEENRRSWVKHYRELLARVKVPVILLWNSSRPQDVPINFDTTSPSELMGRFPQFVNSACVREIAALCDGFVECYSSRNENHLLLSRFTGEPTEVDFGLMNESSRGIKDTRNNYYPSPEMHEDAAEALCKAVKEIKARRPIILS